MRQINFLFIGILFVLNTSAILSAQTITPCLAAYGIADDCPPVQGNYMDCVAGIQRILSRSVHAEDLYSWNNPSTCWNIAPDQPDFNTPVNCNPGLGNYNNSLYDLCWSDYCPDKYCEIIKALVDMKATLIIRAINTHSKYPPLLPATDNQNIAFKQLVYDINAAYDCKGIPRPVIQGSIFEHIDSSIDSITIPCDIINAFRNDEGFDPNYYLDVAGNCKSVNYDYSRLILGSGFQDAASPDIAKIEARMFFYHMATAYINSDYKSSNYPAASKIKKESMFAKNNSFTTWS